MLATNQYITTDSALRSRAIKSYQEVASFLALLAQPGNEHLLDAHFAKHNDLFYSVNLGRAVPNNPDHQGLYLSFVPVEFGGGAELVNHGNGNFEIVLARSTHAKDVLDTWNRDFVRNINRWFSTKKTYYIQNFKRYLRLKYFLDKKALPTFNKGTAQKDPEMLRAFYNDPQEIGAVLNQAKNDILLRIQHAKSDERLKKELGIGLPSTFIKKVFNRYFHPDFKKYLDYSNRINLYKDIYELYLNVEDELKMKDKSKKMTAAELREFVRKEIATLMKESEKGAPEWKSVDKLEKKDTSVQPPKEVDDGDTAPKSLKDLMGMGGDEVLENPEEHLPKSDKKDEKTQLEPSAKPAMNESATKVNAFLLFDLQEDDSFRF